MTSASLSRAAIYEPLDPARYPYREAFVLLDAMYRNTPVMWCPSIFVDNDAALARGWTQGFPKKIGSIFQTHTYAAASHYSEHLGWQWFYSCCLLLVALMRVMPFDPAAPGLSARVPASPDRAGEGRLIDKRQRSNVRKCRHPTSTLNRDAILQDDD
jgi:hypothetical protein